MTNWQIQNVSSRISLLTLGWIRITYQFMNGPQIQVWNTYVGDKILFNIDKTDQIDTKLQITDWFFCKKTSKWRYVLEWVIKICLQWNNKTQMNASPRPCFFSGDAETLSQRNLKLVTGNIIKDLRVTLRRHLTGNYCEKIRGVSSKIGIPKFRFFGISSD